MPSVHRGSGSKLLLLQDRADLRDLPYDLPQLAITSRERSLPKSSSIVDHIVEDSDRRLGGCSHALLVDELADVIAGKAIVIHSIHDRSVAVERSRITASGLNEVEHARSDEGVVVALAVLWIHPFIASAAAIVRAAPVDGLAVANGRSKWVHASCALRMSGGALAAVTG